MPEQEIIMSDILDSVKNYRSELNTRIVRLETILKTSPEGSLYTSKRKNSVYFYHRRRINGKRVSRYLSPDKTPEIRPLALKYCALSTLPKLRENLQASDAFIKKHSGTEEQDIIEKIAPELLSYCGGRYKNKDQAIREWLNTKGPEVPAYEQSPGVETMDGSMVRSKSEALI
jgi:hypothetical protein